MWSRSMLRADTHCSRPRDRCTRTRRTRRLPRVELLEERQLLSGAGGYQFDFGPSSGYAVAPGYIGAANQAFSSTTGYGWQNSSNVYMGGNWWPNSNTVIDDFAYSRSNTFTVNLPNGSYSVVPTLGALAWSQSQVAISLNGQQVASGLATLPGQYISPAYQVNVTNGQLNVQVTNASGKYFWLDALSVLPGPIQSPTVTAGTTITTDAGSSVTFSRATAGGNGPLNYAWYFGDSTSAKTSTSTGVLNPSHVYATAGAYSALFTVTDANGLVVASPVTVNVVSGPTASAGPNQTVNEESPVTLAGSVTGGTAPDTYAWNFGDGTTATGTLTPTHTYTTPGSYTATLNVTDSTGQSSQSSLVVTVNDVAPSVNIGGPYQGSAASAVAFAGSATEPNPTEQAGLTYLWNFGDGTTVTGASASHVFTHDGIYTVALTASNASGLASTATTVVDIFPSVTAGLDPTVNEGETVNFAGTAVGSNSFTYLWNFGDGTTATGTLTPSHVYTTAGTYTATLTAADPTNGLSASSSVVMIVQDVAPTVTIGGPYQGTAGSAIAFAGSATEPNPSEQASLTYLWHFGDGATANGANTSHVFAQGGTYNVTLTTTNTNGLSSTATTQVNVQSQLPTFQFDFGPAGYAAAPGYTAVANQAFSSTTGYGWQTSSSVYPGGNWWPNANPVADDFAYSRGNTFTVNLPNGSYTVVPTLGGYSASQSQVAISLNGQQVASGLATVPGQFISPAYQVSVTNGQLAVQVQNASGKYFYLDALSILPGQVQPPDASAGTAITASAYLSVTFSQATASGSGPLSYAWYFGDTTSATTSCSTGTVNPSHTYTTPGTYMAMLTVTDANGLVVASPVTVTVSSTLAPLVVSAGSNANVDLGNSVAFAGTATGGAGSYTYSWAFGDGATGSGAAPSHTYADIGTYTAMLTVADAVGENAKSSVQVVVADVPPTASAGGPYTYYAGGSLHFQGSATSLSATEQAAGFTYAWNFGDGNAGTGASPTHAYASAGTYTVSVIATDSLGKASAAATSTVTIVNDTTMSVGAGGNQSVSVGSGLVYNGSVTGGVAPFTYNWNFGDGTTATGTLTPSHTYADNGVYYALLTVTDAFGQIASGISAISVSSVGPALSITAPPSGVAGENLYFYAAATDPSAADFWAGFSYAWNFGDGATSTSKAPSHTYAAPGTYTVTATATDKNGATSPVATATVSVSPASTAIPITAAWLAAHGPAPYQITAPGVYQLETNVTTSGGAFKIMSSNATLDLNGHTITYDNAAPITVTNGGFETGNLSGWDVSQAPDAQVIPISSAWWTTGWWGNYLAEMNIPVGGSDTLTSSSITIPTAGIGYTATITPKAAYNVVTVTLSVVDTVTGATLGSATQSPSTVGNGGSINVPFTPSTTDPVKLVVSAVTLPGKSASVLLDYAALNRNNVYGIDMNWNRSNIRITSSVPGGAVVQGSAQSTASSPIYNNYGIGGFTVDNLTLRAGGQDTNVIYCGYSSNVTIRSNTMTASVNRISNRQVLYGFVYIGGPSSGSAGTYDIEGNTMSGSQQSGIRVFGSENFQGITISNNTSEQDSSWGNGYGIYLEGIDNFEIASNTIAPVSGRGIGLAATKGFNSAFGTIHDNYVDVQEHPTLEYGLASDDTIAFRFRNWDGRISDLNIYNNTFYAHNGQPNGSEWAVGARFSVFNSYNGTTGQMNNSNVVVQNNLFKAIVTQLPADHSALDAYALSLAQFDADSGMVFRDNTLESNDVSLQLGSSDGINESDVTLIGTTLEKSSDGISTIPSTDGSVRGYVGIEAGLYGGYVDGVRMIDTRYAGGATNAVKFVGVGSKDISFGSTLQVAVVDASGKPLAGAAVTIADPNGNLVYQGATDSDGRIDIIPLLTTTMSATFTQNSSPIVTTTQVFNVTAKSGTKTGSQFITLTGDQSVQVVVG